MKKCLIFVGMPGSGKSMGTTVAKDLKIPVLVMGDVVREEAKHRNLSSTPKVLGKIMLDLRDKFGSAIIAERCIEKLTDLSSAHVIIDGARSEAEVAAFRRVIESVTVVAVHAAPQVRFQRLVQRRRADDALTWKEFLERDSRELDVGLGRVIAKADVMLVNEGDAENLKLEVLQLLKDHFTLD